MMHTYSRALAPGTYANRAKQAKCYVTFCVCYDVPCLNPSVVAICMYVQYLANGMEAVSSVKNYISGARTWIYEHAGNTAAFSTLELDYMLKSITKDSTHVVKRAFPLQYEHIAAVCRYLDVSPNIPLCIKACILIGYSCYLRSSNLLLPSFNLLGGPHTLSARDIVLVPRGLKIIIRSTKSKSVPYAVTISPNVDSHVCAVNAWSRYVNSQPRSPGSPAFMINSFTPLTPPVVVKIMKDALKCFPDIDVNSITMHSLRRGAVQTADANGAPISDIMKRGGWKSRAGINPYLTS